MRINKKNNPTREQITSERSVEAEEFTASQILDGYKKSSRLSEKDARVLKYLPLVRKFTRNFKCQSKEVLEDLYQVGLMAVIKALNSYNPDRGAKELTYIYKNVWGNMRKYYYKYMIHPMSISLRDSESRISELPPTVSLNDVDVESISDDVCKVVDNQYKSDQLKDIVSQLLSYLTPQQRLAIEHAYGLNGKEVLKGRALADKLGLAVHGRSYVHRGLVKMRKYVDNWDLKPEEIL